MGTVLRMLLVVAVLAPPAAGQKPTKIQMAFRFVSEFGEMGTGPGRFRGPSGITVDPLGNLFVADTGNERVQKFDARGEYLVEVGSFGWEPGQFSGPVGVATGKGLDLYVADSRNNRVQILNRHLGLVGVVGGRDAEGPIELGTLGGIAVSEAGEIYVSDADLDQVVQITDYSRTDHVFGGYGYGAGRLRRPLGVAVGEKGAVYVCDTENDRVVAFDHFGGFKMTLGEGSLSEPAGACVGPGATLFVADTGHNRILVFDLKTGEVVGRTGGPEPGKDPGTFRSPRAVATGPGDVLYVLDTGNCRVQKFRTLVVRR